MHGESGGDAVALGVHRNDVAQKENTNKPDNDDDKEEELIEG